MAMLTLILNMDKDVDMLLDWIPLTNLIKNWRLIHTDKEYIISLGNVRTLT